MNYCKFQKELDDKTIKAYKADLEQFASDVKDRFRNPYIKHKLLDISFTMDSSFWTSSIIDGIKGMVGTSSVNLEKVIKVLSSKITDERTWLNKTIDSIKYSYYEAVDSHMTIELAAEKVRKMKMLSNSLNI